MVHFFIFWWLFLVFNLLSYICTIFDYFRKNDMLSVEELNDRLIDLAFAEDIGDGDHTTLCCIPKDAMGESKLLIKEEGIFAGVEIAKEVFRRFDPELQVEVYINA